MGGHAGAPFSESPAPGLMARTIAFMFPPVPVS
jgi:hypothetical protein